MLKSGLGALILVGVASVFLGMSLTPAAAVGQARVETSASEWHDLFDGKTLNGWTATGHADAWSVEDGMIVCHPHDGGWLRTTDQYRDFELYADFRIARGGNSGMAIRCSSTGDPAFTGMELQIFDSYGKPPSVEDCGAVYDAIAPTVQACQPAGEWNTYHVLIRGDVLNVWLNDQHIIADQKLDGRGYQWDPKRKAPLNTRIKSGYIAFQDHGAEAAFRNVRIRPIDVHELDEIPGQGEAPWVDLFDGHDLKGWFVKGNATWSAEDGQMVGRDGGPGHIFTDGVYTDFDVRAKVWISQDGNSGLYFRVNPKADNPDDWPDGYEAQIDQHDPRNFTGSLYAREWPQKLITHDKDWFDYNVRAIGDQITIAINGQTILTCHRHDYQSGHIALQGHNRGSVVRWRDIQIRDYTGWAKEGVPGRTVPATPMVMTYHSPVTLSDGVVDVFYCTHSAGYQHGVLPETRQIMADLDQKYAWLHVTVSNDIQDMTPEVLAKTDVVMFYTTGELPMTEAQQSAFKAFIARGGGFVGVHSATDTFYPWPFYVHLIGGSFDGHNWHEKVNILTLDRSSPMVVKGWGDSFNLNDEIYKFKDVNPDRHLLLRLDSKSNPDKADGYFPELAWSRDTGTNRVYYNALGHESSTWHDPRFIHSLLRGICWVVDFHGAGDIGGTGDRGSSSAATPATR